MSSIYTQPQREALRDVPVYDYLFQKLHPPVSYGSLFFIHTNTRCGEITGPKESGGISEDPKEGYHNWITGYRAKGGWKGIQPVYALMDYYNTVGNRSYSTSSRMDMALLIAEVCNDMGIRPDENAIVAPVKTTALHAPANMLDKYLAKLEEPRPPVEVPERVPSGGYDPDDRIIRYMAARGIDRDITRDLIGAGLLYLSHVVLHELEKDEHGEPIKQPSGHYLYRLDENGNKIPRTHLNTLTGKSETTTLCNLVFASKDKDPKTEFYERKPMDMRGKSYIARHSSPAGYFSFTGHLPGFAQLETPLKTGQPRRAYICEAPIDAISLYVLHQKLGRTEPAEYIAISGATKDLAIQRAICEGYDCILALDNDPVGRAQMDARRERPFIDPCDKTEVSLPAIVPPRITFDVVDKKGTATHIHSKDWNDILLAMTRGTNCSPDPAAAMKQCNLQADDPKPIIFEKLERKITTLREKPVLPIQPRRSKMPSLSGVSTKI